MVFGWRIYNKNTESNIGRHKTSANLLNNELALIASEEGEPHQHNQEFIGYEDNNDLYSKPLVGYSTLHKSSISL